MLARRLALAVGIVLAIIASQGPEFAQQYRQRLGGALEELRRVVGQFDADASAQNLSRDQGLEQLAGNGDPLARQRAEALRGDAARLDRLAAQRDAYASGGPLWRLAAVAGNFDGVLMRDAMGAFEPAMPLTGEALTLGAVALVLGWGATHLTLWPLRRRWRERARRRDSAALAAKLRQGPAR